MEIAPKAAGIDWTNSLGRIKLERVRRTKCVITWRKYCMRKRL
jgi:hypothetical protein